MKTEELLIQVDENDTEIGLIEKMTAHYKGILHRAVSVFVVNSNGKWILQQRAFSKYHSPGLWTNTCCTHPLQGESTYDAARRRLQEEMGLEVSKMTKIFDFIYKEQLKENLFEHELDHVFVAYSDALPIINKNEVNNWKAIDYNTLMHEIEKHPEQFTVWFKLIVKQVETYLNV